MIRSWTCSASLRGGARPLPLNLPPRSSSRLFHSPWSCSKVPSGLSRVFWTLQLLKPSSVIPTHPGFRSIAPCIVGLSYGAIYNSTLNVNPILSHSSFGVNIYIGEVRGIYATHPWADYQTVKVPPKPVFQSIPYGTLSEERYKISYFVHLNWSCCGHKKLYSVAVSGVMCRLNPGRIELSHSAVYAKT